MLDALDSKAVNELMTSGRMSWAGLASRLGLSAPAAAERVRKLEERGVIRGFSVIVAPDAIGLDLLAFVAVALDRPEHRETFLAWASDCPNVQECHHLAGDDDYLIKLRCRGTSELERIISDELKGLPGIAGTRTSIALSTVKETVALPVSPTVDHR